VPLCRMEQLAHLAHRIVLKKLTLFGVNL
jgi:hypothetical protein